MVTYAICHFLWFKINIVPSLDENSARSSGRPHSPAAQISSWAEPGCIRTCGQPGGTNSQCPFKWLFFTYLFNIHLMSIWEKYFLVIKIANLFVQIQCEVLPSFLDVPPYFNIFRIASHHSFPTTHNQIVLVIKLTEYKLHLHGYAQNIFNFFFISGLCVDKIFPLVSP